MCGIAGLFDFQNGRKIELQCLRAMVQQIRHRGPDGTGIKLFNNVGLGHSRLSIIDLETGDQPIHNEDQTVWTVFNGEIFNYIELRESLLKKGHIFSTQSDTEVIVHLYEEYGFDFVKHLNGQFAIALYDERKNCLLLIRDRIGIAPLFYTQQDSRLYFASEVKSLLAAITSPPELNVNALDQIFNFWAPVSPETTFKNISEVSPGQMLIIENGKLRINRYWDWEFPQDGMYLTGSDDQLAEESKIKININTIRNERISTDGNLSVENGIFDITGGQNGKPKTKVDSFAKQISDLDSNFVPDIAFMKFCYVDFNPTTDVEDIFTYYKNNIEILQKQRPDIKFAHLTVPLNSGNSINERINRFLGRFVWSDSSNAKRADFNKFLYESFPEDSIFDIAQLESTLPDGSRSSFVLDGKTYYSLAPVYTNDGGHLNAVGRRQAAIAIVEFLSEVP